ncbi:MAG: BON domain-containing protein, partial [Acidimicrobiales bacterium]
MAVLNGFVANDAESREAETAAAAVQGITAVENNLVILEPQVVDALRGASVTGATAIGEGTEITISGTIDTEADRAPAIAAAEAVEGVTSVIDDRLNVSVTADLNALPQVQFATNSAVILPGSFGDLDAAAELLAGIDDVNIEVQGYT